MHTDDLDAASLHGAGIVARPVDDYLSAQPRRPAARLTLAANVAHESTNAAVGMLIPEFPSQTHAFFWREIRAWRAAGVRVRIFSSRRPAPGACPHEWAEEARRETTYLFPPSGVALGRLALHPIGTARAKIYVLDLSESRLKDKMRVLGLIPSALELMRQCARDGIRHVHCHSFANAAHLCALARILGGPTYSLTLHGDLPVYGTDHVSKLRHCLAVTTAGPHLVEPVASLGVARERILSNPMGVDTERFSPPTIERPVVAGELSLLTVARLNRNKGHRYALEAMRRLVDQKLDLKYTIVGEGPYRGEIEQTVRELGLQERVRLLGGRGESQVLELLRSHDVFVLPSVGLGEAAPVSVMEAMACGVPVVASIIGSTPAMISDGETGFLVPQEDVGALERTLGVLTKDIVLRREVGKAARAAAVEQFDARTSSLRLLEHLRACGANIAEPERMNHEGTKVGLYPDRP